MKGSKISKAILLSAAALTASATLAAPAIAGESFAPTPSAEAMTASRVNLAFIRATLFELEQRLKTDASYRAQWESNPREVLSQLGLSKDVQARILVEQGIDPAFPVLDCSITCICSNSITNG